MSRRSSIEPGVWIQGIDQTEDVSLTSCPAICRAIVETGSENYLAHAFIPTANDPQAP
jgi:hypothetical protein